MTEFILDKITRKYPLTPQDVGQYGKLKAGGMRFTVRRFQAEGLGSVSVMRASGFLGMMKMDTLIINPTEKDMPLLSYDRVFAMGNDTLIFELYDTFLEQVDLTATRTAKDCGSHLPEHDVGSHWYDNIKLDVSFSKKGKKGNTPDFDELVLHYIDGFLSDCENAPSCDARAKREKASVYVEGLLKNGGPSTDVFQKAIGGEKTAELFRTVLFATKI